MEGTSLLSRFLERNGLSLRDFAAKIDAPVALVWRWTHDGEGQPGIDYALAIEDATGGAVPFRAWAKEAKQQSARRAGRKVAR
jgi:hypothetical protein